MILPDAQTLYDVIDRTWPPAQKQMAGPWCIRLDGSGSSRVSAATAAASVTDADIPQAEAAMRAAGQTPLFMIREQDTALDAWLAARGYAVKDPVTLYAGDAAAIAQIPPPPSTSLTVWPALAVQREIWAAGGIKAGRLAIMDRAPAPKTTVLGRLGEEPAGTAFVGGAGDCAMIHALEVAAAHRRKGLARHMTRAAAVWALRENLRYLTLVTTRANLAANALYAAMGMADVGKYHYRIAPQAAA